MIACQITTADALRHNFELFPYEASMGTGRTVRPAWAQLTYIGSSLDEQVLHSVMASEVYRRDRTRCNFCMQQKRKNASKSNPSKAALVSIALQSPGSPGTSLLRPQDGELRRLLLPAGLHCLPGAVPKRRPPRRGARGGATARTAPPWRSTWGTWHCGPACIPPHSMRTVNKPYGSGQFLRGTCPHAHVIALTDELLRSCAEMQADFFAPFTTSKQKCTAQRSLTEARPCWDAHVRHALPLYRGL